MEQPCPVVRIEVKLRQEYGLKWDIGFSIDLKTDNKHKYARFKW